MILWGATYSQALPSTSKAELIYDIGGLLDGSSPFFAAGTVPPTDDEASKI
jgi:hypothetical protein